MDYILIVLSLLKYYVRNKALNPIINWELATKISQEINLCEQMNSHVKQ